MLYGGSASKITWQPQLLWKNEQHSWNTLSLSPMECDVTKNHTPYYLDSWRHHTMPHLFWKSWPIKLFIFEHYHFQSWCTATKSKSLWLMQAQIATEPSIIDLCYKWCQTCNANMKTYIVYNETYITPARGRYLGQDVTNWYIMLYGGSASKIT